MRSSIVLKVSVKENMETLHLSHLTVEYWGQGAGLWPSMCFYSTLYSSVHPSFSQHAAVLLPCPPAGVQLSPGTLQTKPDF